MEHRKAKFSLTKDGRLDVERKGIKGGAFRDFYHSVLSARWSAFLGSVVLFFFFINLVFTLLYSIETESIVGDDTRNFWTYFSFSVQTISTIGYGALIPNTPWAHALVFFESGVGITFSAVVTGLTFAKIARPTSRVMFAKHLMWDHFDGKPAIKFRMANARLNQVVEAHVNVYVGRREILADGKPFRRLYDLELMRSTQPMFALSWTVVHFLEEDSVLYNITHEELLEQNVVFIVSFQGYDEALGQQIYSRWVYDTDDIMYGADFADVVSRDEDGSTHVDYSQFHAIKPNKKEKLS